MLGLKNRQSTEVVQHLFDYMFGYITKSNLRSLITDDTVYHSIQRVLQNGYLLKNCKLYLYAKSNGYVKPSDYGICKDDIYLLNSIQVRLNGKTCKPFTIENLDWLVSHLYSSEFNAYIGKYINKKLRFLVKSYGVDKYELRSELQFAGIYAIYKKYPYFTSKLHALNIAKRAIHNRGINLISFYTRKRRQQLLQDGDGFVSRCCDIDKLPISADTSFTEKSEVTKTLDQLIQNSDRRGSLLIKLARGDYDEKFSNYLTCNNSDYVEKVSYKKYMRTVCKYLCVSPETAKSYIERLKRYF